MCTHKAPIQTKQTELVLVSRSRDVDRERSATYRNRCCSGPHRRRAEGKVTVVMVVIGECFRPGRASWVHQRKRKRDTSALRMTGECHYTRPASKRVRRSRARESGQSFTLGETFQTGSPQRRPTSADVCIRGSSVVKVRIDLLYMAIESWPVGTHAMSGETSESEPGRASGPFDRQY